MDTCKIWILGALALVGAEVAIAAGEREMLIGASEYAVNCASCHGMNGKGSGPVASSLSKAPPDLTQLMTRNNGRFPFFEVYEVISGETRMSPHGDPEMPVWGARLTRKAERKLGMEQRPYPGVNVDEIVEGRILRIVYYLRAIQE